jgi:hypothetical protein
MNKTITSKNYSKVGLGFMPANVRIYEGVPLFANKHSEVYKYE